ncbi:nuclease-related domain-containing protein [Fredinandcohnia sp. 179-A 10B2 NHS]|uniref:nuclease-related domain-containing protein n=1 Tax=Fredinandcohnia sp. 179-A 10B2 NHS TaxID=3235176 RepID=UPI0039A083AF
MIVIERDVLLIKKRTLPEELLLLTSLRGRSKLEEKYENQFYSLEKGYKGELVFDKWLESLKVDCIILRDLLLEVNNTQFQIDTLVIFQSKILMFEVKNYEGDYYLKDNKWYTSSGTEIIKSPLIQLNRSEALLKQLLHSLGFNFPIESHLVFVNPEFFLYQAPMSLPIVFPTQVNRFVCKLDLIPSKISVRHYNLAEKLVSLHLAESSYKRVPEYSFEKLDKGVLCACGEGFMVKSTQNLLICEKCGLIEKNEPAILRCIDELFILFPKMKITKKRVYEWSNGVVSQKTLQKVLTNNYITVELGKGSHYVKSN